MNENMIEQQCRQRAASVSDRSLKALALPERAAFSASRDGGNAGEGSAARGLAVISSHVPTLRRHRPHPQLHGTFAHEGRRAPTTPFEDRRKSRKRIGTYVNATMCALWPKCALNQALSARRSAYQQGCALLRKISAQCAALFKIRRRRKSRKHSGTYVDLCNADLAIVVAANGSPRTITPRFIPIVCRRLSGSSEPNLALV